MSSKRGRPPGSAAFRQRLAELQAQEDEEEAEAVQVAALDRIMIIDSLIRQEIKSQYINRKKIKKNQTKIK